jgi:LDH2 family malate/lactate/ureidoglycolate dehydrogenase
MDDQPRVRSEDVGRFLRQAFTGLGLPKVQVDAVVSQLVVTSLRGVDTHGITLAERYLEGIKSGDINKKPKVKLVKDKGSIAVIDGDNGLGAYLATEATKLAIKKAKVGGIGSVSLVNLTHCGALSYFGLLVAERKMAAIAFTSSSNQAAAWGGATPIFGTNPLCFAFPYTEGHIVLDIATTVAAGQKIMFAIRDGKPIPLGWALDSKGRPTTDPNEAVKGALLPFGGHKGYGLMFASEVYSAILGGGGPSYAGTGRYFQGGFYVQALDIAAFRSYPGYLSEMKKLAGRIRASKPAEGFERVYLPGEIELITYAKRTKEGIPVDHETWAYFQSFAKKAAIPLPKPL